MLKPVLVLFIVALTACHRQSVDERSLIGKWSSHSMDVGWVLTLKPDHTLTLVTDGDGWREGDEGIPGIWHIEGNELVTEYYFDKSMHVDGLPDKQTQRERILKISADTMQLAGGGYPYTRVE